ncbi:apolipoprotein N-acyltransferase [Nocardioides cynanchi]|uniref:apolipoprotein N-acyltransferase n=1 Tax=Nocardioides cynanchi TaxID=2558918 RepID=UPI0012449696|nr:apolipoprotein N-acyltransferase [Nocardioides cynanchi]
MPARILLALLAGAGLSLPFQPTHVWLLLPLAVAAFFVLTGGLPARTAWLPGLAFGAAFQVTLLWWLHVVGTLPWLGLAAAQALWYGLLGAAAVPLRRLPAAPVWLAVAWVAMENLRTDWPAGGMPWGRLSYAVVDTPLARLLPYVGATGVSLVLALVGALLAATCTERGRARVVVVAALGAVLALGLVPQVAPYDASPVSSIRVAAVQGNVPGDGTDVLAHYREITASHTAETERLARDVATGATPRPDFVVWPENSTAVDPFLDPSMGAELTAAVSAVDVPLLAGVVVADGPRHVLNQGIVFDPVTGAGDRYTKWHPVPFGEYVPWRSVFGSHLPELAQVRRDMVRGTRVTPLEIAGTHVADAICFDVAYDDGLYAQLSHGGQLIVVQTSNAMFIHTAQIDQQFAISRLRALETDRYVVVAAINGVTGVIAPDGTLVTSAPLQTRSYVEARVGLIDAVTPAVLIGPSVGRGCVLLVVAGWLLAWGLQRGQYRRSRRPAPAPEVPISSDDRTYA